MGLTHRAQLHCISTWLCGGDPGLLSTVQLSMVVVHQLGGGIGPLCPCLGCPARGLRTWWPFPPHGHRNLPSKNRDCCCILCSFGAKIKAAGSWKRKMAGLWGLGQDLEPGAAPTGSGVHPALLLGFTPLRGAAGEQQPCSAGGCLHPAIAASALLAAAAVACPCPCGLQEPPADLLPYGHRGRPGSPRGQAGARGCSGHPAEQAEPQIRSHVG